MYDMPWYDVMMLYDTYMKYLEDEEKADKEREGDVMRQREDMAVQSVPRTSEFGDMAKGMADTVQRGFANFKLPGA